MATTLDERWARGPSHGALRAAREAWQRRLVGAACSALHDAWREREARKMELQALLAARSFESYEEDCAQIEDALADCVAVPAYSSLPHVRRRAAAASQQFEEESSAVADSSAVVEARQEGECFRAAEEAAINVLRSGITERADAGMPVVTPRASRKLKRESPSTEAASASAAAAAAAGTPQKRSRHGLPLKTPAPRPLAVGVKVTPSMNKVAAHKPGRAVRGGGGAAAAVGSPGQQEAELRHCTCRKSACLKLYCGCFANSAYCGERCRCASCRNLKSFEDLRQAAIGKTLQRYPNAFAPKGEKTLTCTCKKSRCLKLYCDCFRGDVLCGESCRCIECQNTQGSAELAAARKQAGTRSAHANKRRVQASPMFPIKRTPARTASAR